MIFVDFEEPKTDSWQKWRQQCDVKTDELIQRHEAGEQITIGNLYKHSRMQEIYKRQEKPFHGKCAYCESDVLVSQHGDIEHWRPKGAVTDEHNKTVYIRDENGTVSPHPGYYWLAYEWTNLLLSCVLCNQISSSKPLGKLIGKGTRFPVKGDYARRRGEETTEEPLLLNPAEEDPDTHLSVDVTIGIMIPKSERGRISIEILGLNREALVVARYRCLRSVESLVKEWRTAGTVIGRREAELRMERIRRGKEPYSAAGRAILRAANLA